MTDFILALLETERLSSAIIISMVAGFGWFFAVKMWPWLTERIDKSLDDWVTLKREGLKIEADRNERFASAWQENTKRLAKMDLTIQTLVEGQKALIGTLLSFVDDRKLQDRLYSIFYDDEKQVQ